MLKLIKYFKPYVFTVILAIALLFVQAMADLALPDYMSNIVNKGIQQGGIVNSVPEAIRESEMNRLTLFMKSDFKEDVMKYYKLTDKSGSDYEKLVKKYPKLSEEKIYVLENSDKEVIEKLNSDMGKALLAVAGIKKIKAEAKNGVLSFNGVEIPPEQDIFLLVSQMPEEQRTAMMEDMNKKFIELGENMIDQAASLVIKEEYKAIGMDTDKIQSGYIRYSGFLMLLVALVSGLCTVLVGFLAAKCSAGISRDIRKDVFAQVQSFSNNEFDKFSTASLITRTTNDVTQVQMLVFLLIRMVFYAPITGIGGVIRALGKSSSMSWIITVVVAVLLGLVIVIFSIALPKFKAVQKLIDRLNLVMRENLSGIMVIRAFNTQKFEEKRFDTANRNLTKTSLFVNRVMATLFPIMMLIMNGVTLLVVWVGAHKIAESSIQVGDLMAFIQYVMQIIFSFIMMSMMFIMIPRASVSAQRIAEVLSVKPVIKDPEKPAIFHEQAKGIVEFRNVFFKYPGADDYMLKDINFTALPGQTTAFIGSTGSGKTTLINLIPRFYDVTEGQILVEGRDVRDVSQKELRDKIGYVPQKGSLFSGTIESNIKYADENISDDDMRNAAEIAQAMEFINEKPEKFNSEISQGGTNVSGGQKQRLSIARALVKKPSIYIFDDSFSALDFKTDAALRKALKNSTKDSTILIVAQRVSTIKNADQIIVLDEGRIVGMGTHEDLMKNCATYLEIALSQLSKEELA